MLSASISKEAFIPPVDNNDKNIHRERIFLLGVLEFLAVLRYSKLNMQEENIWNLIGKKLSGEASDEELFELENLLRGNPDLHYPMQTIIDFWNPGHPQNTEEAGMAFKKHVERMKRLNIDYDSASSKNQPKSGDKELPLMGNGEKNTQKKVFLSAFALVLLGSVFLLIENQHSVEIFQTPSLASKINSEISTRNGSRTNIVLPDGSLVWLNAGSKLSYDRNYGNTMREINLTGEAFFDVIHNPEKPFVIHTSKMDIKVLGTRFNVKSYPADKTSEATLIRGSIEVSIKDGPSQKIILKPNQKIVLANTERTPMRNHSALGPAGSDVPLLAIKNLTYEPGSGDIVETSWVENKLIFRDEPFKELAAQMERWFGVTIRFQDPSKEELRFTGSFKNETIQQALEALRLTVEFNYGFHDNEIIIYDK